MEIRMVEIIRNEGGKKSDSEKINERLWYK